MVGNCVPKASQNSSNDYFMKLESVTQAEILKIKPSDIIKSKDMLI